MQYKVRVALRGYVEGPQGVHGPFITTASRLEGLDAHINRWKHLDWVESRTRIPLGLGNPRHRTHVLAGGVFLYFDSDTLTCIELPSIICRTPGRTWSHTHFNFPLFSFAADPEQDLLVLVEL